MATANTITDGAYRKIGINDPTSDQDDEALEDLNNMLSMWGIDFLVPYVTRESLALTIGDAEYTVGSGGDLDTVRPVSIQNCYLVDSEGYSYPVKVRSAADYNRVSFKTSEGRPRNLYFIPEYTLAKIIFHKEPEQAYTAYFEFWKNFTEFAALTTTFEFPNEYKEAMVYNLAIKLGENNTIAVPASVIETARESKFLISRLNAVNEPPPIAQFDFGGGSPSNITTGE
ncbi:MAG: hypothetical protein WBC22_17120 [Sedimentisphaerales bacterium]